VALTLAQGRDRAKAATRHRVDTRITNDDWDAYLNQACRQVRNWLSEKVPSLYLATSTSIVVTDDDPEIALESSSYNFGNVWRVERLYDDRWRPISRAGETSPNESIHGDFNFRVEHLCLVIGPDTVDVSGTYRVLYHPIPAVVSEGTSYLQVPALAELPVLHLACSLSAIQDFGPDHAHVKAFRDLAKEDFADGLPALQRRHGLHERDAGPRRKMRRW
jgi:hypothetical protein